MSDSICIGVNAPRDLGSFNTNITDRQIRSLKKIVHNHLSLADLMNKELFDILVIDSSFSKNIFDQKHLDDVLIYDVAKKNDSFIVSTGNYIGQLVVDGITLRINSGYGSFFTKRLLDFSNDIFVGNDRGFAKDESEDVLEQVIHYLFISSLRRAGLNGLPKKYKVIRETGYSVRGNINISEYLRKGCVTTRGLPYIYRSMEYDQDILDVIARALSICNSGSLRYHSGELTSINSEIMINKSSRPVSSATIQRARRSPMFNNQMYSQFRKTLSYAEMVIKHDGSSPVEGKNKSNISGWLLNVADLWELYLYQILKRNFVEWDVSFQERIPVYTDLFFGTIHGEERTFAPDIVMKKGNEVVVLDAKFKKMDFNRRGNDVDRDDLHQIHSYYAYYCSAGYKVKAISLVYPTRSDDVEGKKTVSSIYGGAVDSKFAISYLKVASNTDDQILCEKEFINRLNAVIE